MSTLLVIRHGQASFGKADYDNLTPVGVEQAQLLGRWLAAEGPRIDRLYVGPRRRQRDTARHMVDASDERIPAAELAPELDEYPAEAIMRQALPRLMEVDPEAREVFGGDPGGIATDARRFQRVFERVMHRWVAADAELDLGDTESFAAFARRCGAAYEAIMAASGRGVVVAAVTSAGPTSIACQKALELTDPVTLKTSWVVANSAITELRFRDDELTLVAFNALPHLPRRLVTYR
jgi:broad specificity phosphatase PhoE